MNSNSRRRSFLAGLFAIGLASSGCGKGRTIFTPPTSSGPQVNITGASVNSSGHVVASYKLVQNGQGIGGTAATGLAPNWTLAGLSIDPVSIVDTPDDATGLVRPPVPAWTSYVLTGSGTLSSLPIDGPGTPDPWVLTSTKQPGSESSGVVQDLGGGNFTYTFNATLPGPIPFDPSQFGTTLRVGVWLAGTPGTPQTSSTFDFVPSGGAVQSRELVLDANCNKCHGTIQAHGGFRTGVKLCQTCHTFQNADPDTVDPAALLANDASTNPNPLDLGRMVHRIHRGRDLPTLYTANAPVQGTSAHPNVAQPFFPGVNPPNTASRKYSIVGFRSSETVFGQILTRTDNNQSPGQTVATGVRFPQPLRNCAACHGGAAQAEERFTDISRRTCQGCHTDTWFETPADPTANPDAVHFLHPGGPQSDDSQCIGCHVPTSAAPVVDADITAPNGIHAAPAQTPYWNGLTAQIVGVQNMKPGESPTVVFTLADRDGPVSPLNSPDPAMDPDLAHSGAFPSPVPRALSRVAVTVSGPTAPDYATGNFATSGTAPISEALPLTTAANGSGQFTFTFNAKLPADATGTWAVSIEASRSATTSYYTGTGSDTYVWPFTGETLTEYANNPVAYVDVASGTLGAGSPAPRRQVVKLENCNNCHLALTAHGGLRHDVEYCVMCHAADASDWAMRPHVTSGGNVDLGSTFDGIEERSIHFRSLIHRIHTGARTGSAELDVARPFVVYGFHLPGQPVSPSFFDDVRFPNDLANCTLCHQGGTHEIESVPAGARATVANETATIQHAGTAAHGPSEATRPPVQAACLGCHDTGAAQLHAQSHTVSGVEQCVQCHGQQNALLSVDIAHGLSQ